ncbi:MAG: EAL domain-containing protein [Tissierellaceae bacterium]|nr:EAL domain-containing protein [Tissierellaceae bacterium]
MKKHFMITIILIIFIVLFSGFVVDAAEQSQETKKVYRFAANRNFPPFEFLRDDGQFVGFNVDLINAICEVANIEVNIVPVEWDNLLWSLKNRDFDGALGMAQSSTRVKEYKFAIPTIEKEQVIFANKDKVHILDTEDLAGLKVAYQRGNYNEDILAEIPDVKHFPQADHKNAILMLINGQVDAVLGDKMAGIYQIQRNKATDKIIVVGNPAITTYYGIVVTKENEELLGIINEGMEIIIDNGTFDMIYGKWFGENINYINIFFEEHKFTIVAGAMVVITILVLLAMYNTSLQNEVLSRTSELELANNNLIKHQEEIYNLAYFDPITSLPNRTYFVEELNNILNKETIQGSKLAVFFLDIDKFKHINDTLGHDIGDYILKLMGNRLAKVIDKKHLIARVGGDEYYILINGYGDLNEITDFANKIIDDFKEPYFIKEYTLYLTTSIGIATYPDGGMDTNTLIKNADLALYKSKDLGGNTYYIYGEEIESKGLDRMMLLNQLRHALEYDELVLHYQPQIEISTGKIRGVEALVRWQHPEKGLLYPDEFISLAEESGIIIPMGEWILKKACVDAKRWEERGHDIVVSVNISSKQFQYRDFLNEVVNAIYVSGVNPKNLTLEITESIAISDMDHTLKILRSLRGLGISVAIDDFGTGYSSLSYLNDMNVNELKIDKSFIWDIEKNEKNKMISNTIILLAKQLGLQVIAEGVENLEQLTILEELDCHVAQGYHFYRPVPVNKIDEIINEKSPA